MKEKYDQPEPTPFRFPDKTVVIHRSNLASPGQHSMSLEGRNLSRTGSVEIIETCSSVLRKGVYKSGMADVYLNIKIADMCKCSRFTSKP